MFLFVLLEVAHVVAGQNAKGENHPALPHGRTG
jgi:hypothetical protein